VAGERADEAARANSPRLPELLRDRREPLAVSRCSDPVERPTKAEMIAWMEPLHSGIRQTIPQCAEMACSATDPGGKTPTWDGRICLLPRGFVSQLDIGRD